MHEQQHKPKQKISTNNQQNTNIPTNYYQHNKISLRPGNQIKKQIKHQQLKLDTNEQSKYYQNSNSEKQYHSHVDNNSSIQQSKQKSIVKKDEHQLKIISQETKISEFNHLNHANLNQLRKQSKNQPHINSISNNKSPNQPVNKLNQIKTTKNHRTQTPPINHPPTLKIDSTSSIQYEKQKQKNSQIGSTFISHTNSQKHNTPNTKINNDQLSQTSSIGVTMTMSNESYYSTSISGTGKGNQSRNKYFNYATSQNQYNLNNNSYSNSNDFSNNNNSGVHNNNKEYRMIKSVNPPFLNQQSTNPTLQYSSKNSIQNNHSITNNYNQQNNISSLPSFLTKKISLNNQSQINGINGKPLNYNRQKIYTEAYTKTQNIKQPYYTPYQQKQNQLSRNEKLSFNPNFQTQNSRSNFNNIQTNSKSNLTVRNLQYGRPLNVDQTNKQRTKSHTKNYTTQFESNYFTTLQNQSTPYTLNYQKKHPTQENQRSKIMSTNVYSNVNTQNYTKNNYSFYSNNQNKPSYNKNTQANFHQTQNLSTSNNYPMDKNSMSQQAGKKSITPNQKVYILDSISQKEEFSINKLFVRNNQNQQKVDDKQFLHRQKDYNNKNSQQQGSKKMINIVSDSHYLSSDYSKNNLEVNDNNLSTYLDIKYIKSPINKKSLQQSPQNMQMMKSTPQQNVKNYQKYLKMNYPYQHQQRLQKTTSKFLNLNQQHAKNQPYQNPSSHINKSLNNSFTTNNNQNYSYKDNKSQTHSVSNKTQKNYYNFQEVEDNNKPYSIKQYNINAGDRFRQNQSNKNYKYFTQKEQEGFGSNNNNQKLFRKILDINFNLPEFRQLRNIPHNNNEKKQKYSLGYQDKRQKVLENNLANHYQRNNSQNKVFNAYDNQPFYRLNSPESKISNINQTKNAFAYKSPQISSTNNASNTHSHNKLTLFSPSQKTMKPSLKNHFLSGNEKDNQNNRQNAKNKKSIKKMLVSQSKYNLPKAEILYSLNYKDLRGQGQSSRPNSRTILDVLTKNQLAKILCSTFKIGQNQNGCDCIPKCFWIDQWIQKLNRTQKNFIQVRSLMKNVNKNFMNQWQIYSSQDNILFKNASSNEAISFQDFNINLSTQDVDTFKQIQKDIPRTCSDHPTFKNQKYRDFLRQLLINFYYLDKKLGYVQGMNIIGASFVYHSKTIQQSLQLMDYIMNILRYRQIYQNDMKACKQLSLKTCKIIRHYCYDMYNYVTIQNQVQLQMFIMGWYFSMLGSFVPLQAMHLIINKFIQKQMVGIMQIIVTYFIFIKDILMQKQDSNQIMQQLSIQSMIQRSKKIDWAQLVLVSDKLKISLDKQDI